MIQSCNATNADRVMFRQPFRADLGYFNIVGGCIKAERSGRRYISKDGRAVINNMVVSWRVANACRYVKIVGYPFRRRALNSYISGCGGASHFLFLFYFTTGPTPSNALHPQHCQLRPSITIWTLLSSLRHPPYMQVHRQSSFCKSCFCPSKKC